MMAYIFMDESGDLGFDKTKNNSHFFLVTFLLTDQEKEVEVIMKHVYQRMAGKKIKRKDYFHSNKELKSSVKRALDLASRRNIFALAVILDKSLLSWKEKQDSHALYNRLVRFLLAQCEKRGYVNGKFPLYFIASRKETNKKLNHKFIEYIQESVSDLIDINVQIIPAWTSKWLELVDAISFSLYQKYEMNNLELYSVIKNKILLEKFFE